MPTVSQILQKRLQHALQAIGITNDEPPQLSPTIDPRHGDYQTNAAMVLGKKLKQNARNLATRIVANLSADDLVALPEVAGVKSIDDLVPSDQQAKLKTIAGAAGALEPAL